MSSLEDIGVGIIGCGRIARRHVEAVEHLPGVKVVAVTDPVKEAALSLAEQAGAAYVPDAAALVEHPGVDVVIVASPSGLHAEQAILAARAGRHVLVEKPLALDYEQAQRMIGEAQRAGVLLGVVHPLRFLPLARRLHEMVAAGKLGRISHAAVTVRWNRNTEYYQASPWRGTRNLDGGMLLNQAVHHIDLLCWYLGDVTRVSAEIARRCHDIETEDVALLHMRFASGTLGLAEVTTNIYPKNLEEEVAIFGEYGTVVLGGRRINELKTWRVEGEPPEEEVLREYAARPPREPWRGHYDVLADFCRAIREGKEPEISGRRAWPSLSVILAAYASSARGSAVEPQPIIKAGSEANGRAGR